ncbi:DUF3515 family protein [Catenuloplanes indicus]|uniref:DUF3515 domain-containing protein n=1 Tax=Catenuloplanes indicus TaxID=137267 RepID=A0AAE3W300_9ACTN|nr:DUF3515 family protein [Catenuloplanes indicus]MDQ0369028.1 hypothetical protein [Catenuloplanes indicus]
MPAEKDRTTRTAALWATAVAVPAALAVGIIAVSSLPSATPSATPASGAPQPASTVPVEMAAPALDDDETVACRALTSQLPVTVRNLAQRPVSAGPEQNVAYGDPAITVACGGEQPSFLATDLVYPLNKVCWHATETPDASIWTTVDRRVPVTVTIPKSYDSPGQWTTEFSTTVLSTLLSREDVPTGCRS